MPNQASDTGLRIDHSPNRVVIESPHEGLCSSCADQLPDDLFELLGNVRFETDSRPAQVSVVVYEPMSVEAVETLADRIEKSIGWCNGGHQGGPGPDLDL